MSAGTRGSRSTVQPYGSTAKPLPPSPSPPPMASPAPAPRVQAPAPRVQAPPPPLSAPPGFFQRHPFVGGLMGGLVGAGIGSMLFGGHFFGEGAGGLLGVMLQMLLLALVVGVAVSFFRRRPSSLPSMAYRPSMPVRGPDPLLLPVEFTLAPTDLAAFESLLTEIQAAWSAGDLSTLRQLATGEMAALFAGQIEDGRAQGVENRVEQVRLVKGDVNETWREGPLDYATVTMCWNAVDYTVRHGSGAVVGGDPRTPVQSIELWTFVRRNGGSWQLSAIQQPN